MAIDIAPSLAIRAFSLCRTMLGWVEILRSNGDLEDAVSWGSDEARAQMTALHPIGRFGQPREIAEPVLWLLSDESSFVTGQTIAADGGFTAQ